MTAPKLYRKPKGRDCVDHYDLIDRCRTCTKRADAEAGSLPSCDCMVIAVGVRPLRDFVDCDDDILWGMRSVLHSRQPWRGRR